MNKIDARLIINESMDALSISGHKMLAQRLQILKEYLEHKKLI